MIVGWQDLYTACGGRFLGLCIQIALVALAAALVYGKAKPTWGKTEPPWLCEPAEIPDPTDPFVKTEWTEEER
jgi:hypothetical protein